MLMNRSTLLAIVTLTSMTMSAQTHHEWARTPPMGWNSWDCFGPTVTEQEVKANADYMAKYLRKSAWEYVVVDIRWYVENDKAHGYNETDPVICMDTHGRLTPAINRFPSAADGAGFQPLAAYVHSLGLKFGIHIMRGVPKLAVERNIPVPGTRVTARDIHSTSHQSVWLKDMYTVDASKPGAQEYYNSLFALYASWGVDLVKVDDISSPYRKDEIELIRRAIDRCGRPIVLSLSPGPAPLEEATHVSTHANMWRVIGDFWDNWSQLEEHFSLFAHWIPSMGPGHWPDGDMLPLGRIGIRAEQGDPRATKFTRDEQTALMSLFLICRSPLMFGGNLPDNDPFTLDLISNEEALAVLQRSRNNRLLLDDGQRVVWVADDEGTEDRYVALFFADRRQIDVQRALWSSPLLTHEAGKRSASTEVRIAGARKLFLVVTEGGNGRDWDHADWIDPRVIKGGDTLHLGRIPWRHATSGWSTVHVNQSVGGNTLTVDGTAYDEGIGTHATSVIEYDIPEGYETFASLVGLDGECTDHTEGSTARFHLFTEHPSGGAPLDSIEVTLSAEQLGVKNGWVVRDLWGRRDRGDCRNGLTVRVPHHGAALLKIGKP